MNQYPSSTYLQAHRFRDPSRWGLLLAVFLCGVLIPGGAGAEYRQFDVAADIKSRFSAGCSSVQELMTQAEYKGLDGILFGDHARHTIQYGLPGLERIIKLKMDNPSVLENGAAVFLSEIRQLGQSDDSVTLVPGVEGAPFYYWQGNPLDQDLTARDWDRHLWIVGLPDLAAYEELPILHSGFSTRYWEESYLPFVICIAGALIGFWAMTGKRFRGTAFLFAVVMGLLAANNHPFQSSPYDPYQGDAGVRPYQDLIDYADSKGAMVFWSHLETPVARRMSNGLASFVLKTDSHPQDLLRTRRYTGFQAVNEIPVGAVEPGRQWDQVLLEYLTGRRDRPVWGYGSNNFQCEGRASLGGVRTVVLAPSKDASAVLDAFRAGRMYGIKLGAGKQRLSLDRFELGDPASGNQAVMGETLTTGQAPLISIQVSHSEGTAGPVRIRLIRNGEVVRKAVLRLPAEDVWQDTTVDLSQPAYYRLLVEVDEFNRLVSNPIFLNREASGKAAEMAAKPEPAPTPPPELPERRRPATEEEKVPAPERSPQPAVSSKAPLPLGIDPQYVEVTANRIRLRKGPSIQFPVAGEAVKGERLVFVRKTKLMYKGKPWVVIEKDGNKAYVWSGLVKGP